MKYASILLAMLLGGVVGCSSEPRPAPGMSAVRVTLLRKPKTDAASRNAIYEQDTRVDASEVKPIDYSELRDVVIWIERADGRSSAQAPAAPKVVRVSGYGATTGLSGVASVGQTVIFHNAGLKAMSLYSVSDGNHFHFDALPPLGDAKYVVQRAGLIEVLSDTADGPVARVYAAPTYPAYIARPGESVDFNDLPPGHYLVVTWHRKYPGSVTEVDLSADHVGHASIDAAAGAFPGMEHR